MYWDGARRTYLPVQSEETAPKTPEDERLPPEQQAKIEKAKNIAKVKIAYNPLLATVRRGLHL